MRNTDYEGIGGLLLLLVILLVGGAVMLTQFMGGMYRGYSNGVRVGIVQKVSNKGLFCRSTEGEMVLQSFGSRASRQSNETSAFSNIWEFSARDPQVVRKLEAAASEGRQVRIAYTQYYIKPFCLSTDYEVIGVEGLSANGDNRTQLQGPIIPSGR